MLEFGLKAMLPVSLDLHLVSLPKERVPRCQLSDVPKNRMRCGDVLEPEVHVQSHRIKVSAHFRWASKALISEAKMNSAPT